MLRAITIEALSAIISAAPPVDDDREAQLRLRTVLTAFDYDGCVIDALVELLATGDAVLRVGRHDRRLARRSRRLALSADFVAKVDQ